jgi:hypothetical protein
LSSKKLKRWRKDHRGFDLISGLLPFGRLWYAGPGGWIDAGSKGLILSLTGTELLLLAVVYAGLFFVLCDRKKGDEK